MHHYADRELGSTVPLCTLYPAKSSDTEIKNSQILKKKIFSKF